MTDNATPKPADWSLPAWRWDHKAYVLRPRCPVCDERLMVSGNRLTCLVMGHSHYHEPIEQVVGDALWRLAQSEADRASRNG